MGTTIMERKQKPKSSSIGWDPLGHAQGCIIDMKASIGKCDLNSAIAYTGCVYGNAEAAFYEKQISEEDMNLIKENASELRSQFVDKCKCIKI